jgi:hypothetical protein
VVKVWGPTSEVGLVSLLKDILSDLLVIGTRVEVAVKAAQRILLNDAAHQLAWLAWGQRGQSQNCPEWSLQPVFPSNAPCILI